MRVAPNAMSIQPATFTRKYASVRLPQEYAVSTTIETKRKQPARTAIPRLGRWMADAGGCIESTALPVSGEVQPFGPPKGAPNAV